MDKNKSYKEAIREDIQDFLDLIQRQLKQKRPNNIIRINGSYKAHLLDFYRFLYGLFGEEQPKIYPEVVGWLHQKRKKSHDCIPKEIIPDIELKLMIGGAIDTRDKALITLMADCSARVGEIVNLSIKDIKINEINAGNFNHVIGTIKLKGKTGERTNQLFYSIPYLRLWLVSHPLNYNPEAPLFIGGTQSRYGQRLTTIGVNKILERAARKAGIKRHIHAHLFRHTNLTRMARILSESELKIHAGWGKESNMASVYVHLTEKDVADKILQSYGIKVKEEKQQSQVLEINICKNIICSYQNPGEAKFCIKCGYPLTVETAFSLAKIKQKEQELQTSILSKGTERIDTSKTTDLKEIMYQVLKRDESLIIKLKEIVELAENINAGRQDKNG